MKAKPVPVVTTPTLDASKGTVGFKTHTLDASKGTVGFKTPAVTDKVMSIDNFLYF